MLLTKLADVLRQIESTDISLKEMMIISATTLVLGLGVASIWSGLVFGFVWLTLISFWIYLHIKKSKYTWQRFEDIDERDLEFKDEFELRLEKLEQRMAELAKDYSSK